GLLALLIKLGLKGQLGLGDRLGPRLLTVLDQKFLVLVERLIEELGQRLSNLLGGRCVVLDLGPVHALGIELGVRLHKLRIHSYADWREIISQPDLVGEVLVSQYVLPFWQELCPAI